MRRREPGGQSQRGAVAGERGDDAELVAEREHVCGDDGAAHVAIRNCRDGGRALREEPRAGEEIADRGRLPCDPGEVRAPVRPPLLHRTGVEQPADRHAAVLDVAGADVAAAVAHELYRAVERTRGLAGGDKLDLHCRIRARAARPASEVVLTRRQPRAAGFQHRCPHPHAHLVARGLERRRRLAADQLGAGGLRLEKQRLVEAEPRQAGRNERQLARGTPLARDEPQRPDALRPHRRHIEAETGEKLLRLPAQEVAAHLERRPRRALDDGNARAPARKLQGEGRPSETAADRNGIEIRHAAITARGLIGRNRPRRPKQATALI